MKNSNPLLSIIVPMYNSEKTISQCIDSILNQNIDDFELILVDNAFLDNTLRICEDYSKGSIFTSSPCCSSSEA